jgi:hypothetical protein
MRSASILAIAVLSAGVRAFAPASSALPTVCPRGTGRCSLVMATGGDAEVAPNRRRASAFSILAALIVGLPRDANARGGRSGGFHAAPMSMPKVPSGSKAAVAGAQSSRPHSHPQGVVSGAGKFEVMKEAKEGGKTRPAGASDEAERRRAEAPPCPIKGACAPRAHAGKQHEQMHTLAS